MSGLDSVDKIVEQWAGERPDLDTAGFSVVARVLVLAGHLERRISEVLAPKGLSLWGFDVLATLRRQGEPFRMTPTELSRAAMLTSGAMTNRLDRLEEAGLVRREHNPEDRRGVFVVLTERGRVLVDEAVALRFEEASDAVAGLEPGEREALAALLRRLLLAVESPRRLDGRRPPGADHSK